MHISRIRSEVQNRKISIIKIGKRAAENASNWRVGQLLVLQAECRTPARCFDLALKFNFCFDALVRASISCPIRKSVWTQKYFESLSSIISNAHLLRFIASWEETQLLFHTCGIDFSALKASKRPFERTVWAPSSHAFGMLWTRIDLSLSITVSLSPFLYHLL